MSLSPLILFDFSLDRQGKNVRAKCLRTFFLSDVFVNLVPKGKLLFLFLLGLWLNFCLRVELVRAFTYQVLFGVLVPKGVASGSLAHLAPIRTLKGIFPRVYLI